MILVFVLFFLFFWLFFLGYFVFLEADEVTDPSIGLALDLNEKHAHAVRFDYFIYGSDTFAIYVETTYPLLEKIDVHYAIHRDGSEL